MGSSTVATIFGDKVAAGLLDRYLARTGYKSQQTGEPTSPDRPANLWEPVDGRDGHDFGAHGSFDRQATARSWQFRMNKSSWTTSALVNMGAALVAGTKMIVKDRKVFAAILRGEVN